MINSSLQFNLNHFDPESIIPLNLELEHKALTFLLFWDKETHSAQMTWFLQQFCQQYKNNIHMALVVVLMDEQIEVTHLAEILNSLDEDSNELPDIHVYEHSQLTAIEPDYLAPLLATCDVFISLNQSEEFNPTIYKALAMNKQIIVLDHETNHSLLSEQIAFFIEENNEGECSNALVAIEKGHYKEKGRPFIATRLNPPTLDNSGSPPDIQTVIQLLNNKEASKALNLFEQLVANGMQTFSIDDMEKICELYLANQQYNQALTNLNSFINQVPAKASLFNLLGEAYRGLGYLNKSIEGFQQALSIDPQYQLSRKNLSLALDKQTFNATLPSISIPFQNQGVSLW